jgi:hypothetical protein
MTTDTAFATFEERAADPNRHRRLGTLYQALRRSMADLREANRCLSGNLFALARRIANCLKVRKNVGHLTVFGTVNTPGHRSFAIAAS